MVHLSERVCGIWYPVLAANDLGYLVSYLRGCATSHLDKEWDIGHPRLGMSFDGWDISKTLKAGRCPLKGQDCGLMGMVL